jgi:hypothetical protein
MEHARHVFRAILVLVVVIAVVAIGRGFLVPKSYGLFGAYRADNVQEQMNVRAPRHGGVASCATCHAPQAVKRAAGGHKTVSCEICHGPLSRHVTEGKRTAPMPVDRSYTLCARCHRKVLARPDKFPQVVLEQHLQEQQAAGPVEGKICLDCHDPHSPKP